MPPIVIEVIAPAYVELVGNVTVKLLSTEFGDVVAVRVGGVVPAVIILETAAVE